MKYDLIKQRRRFYVHSYRRVLKLLLFSLVVNVILILGIYYVHVTKPERDFYSTDGIGAPVRLIALMQPNYSSQALLKPDPVQRNTNKFIPD